MSLIDFLIDEYAIRVADFLIENQDRSYTVTALCDCLGLGAFTVKSALYELVDNQLVVEDKSSAHIHYKLAQNKITHALITAVYAHSFMMAEVK